MSTSLLNCEVLLSKALGDYWSSTTTSAGASGGTTLIDTELKKKTADWITDDAHDYISSGTYDEEERWIKSLNPEDGTLSMLAHGGQIASSVTYRVHRLFTASEKRIALVHAAKAAFPQIHKVVWDESRVSGNWLKDGVPNVWTTSTNPTYWTASGPTTTKTTSSPYYKLGATSCKLSGSSGYIYQDIALWDDLKWLAGESIKFTAQGWCDTASCLRLAVLYDGTNLEYSSYHAGGSDWTEDDDPLEVEVDIDDTPTDIEFRVYHDVDTTATSYINDLRVTGPDGARIYIGDLGLAQDRPHQVLRERSNYSGKEPWYLIPDTKIYNDYLYLPSSVTKGYRLRIRGIGYLDYYDTSDVVGTDWDDTIAIDSPQTEILVAEAALYLCNQKVLPNATSADTKRWERAKAYWERELSKRKNKFGMVVPSATVDWGLR